MAATDTSAMMERVDEIVASYQAKPTALIMILQEVQQEFHYLPKEALERVSRKMDLAMSQIYGVATFYKAFSLHPKGRHICSVCTGTACHVRGAPRLLDKLERDLKVKNGGTTKDGRFTVQTVNCVGACALGPVVVIGEDCHGKLTAAKLEKIVKSYK